MGDRCLLTISLMGAPVSEAKQTEGGERSYEPITALCLSWSLVPVA